MSRLPLHRSALLALVVTLSLGSGRGGDDPQAAGDGPSRPAAGDEKRWLPQKPEFLAIAHALRRGANPYTGTAAIAWLRREIEAGAGLPTGRRLELHIKLALELLKHGDTDGAGAAVDRAVTVAEAEGALDRYGFLYRARALVNLRRAEIENCVLRHNRDCCLLPLAGGGVHRVDAPIRAAMADYQRYLKLFPHDLGARWLLNVSAMAADRYPSGVPDELLIPPAAFESEHTMQRFVDRAGDLGVDTFSLCGGAIVDDFDGDRLLDIVTTTFDMAGPLAYYRNAGDGSFQDLSDASRLSDQLGGLNGIAADYDNDGDLDLLVLRGAWLADDGRIRNSLLRNDGQGVFTDVTRVAGVAEPAAPTQAAVWGDFDNDGDLDLFVGVESWSAVLDPAALYRNDGDGAFTEAGESAGISRRSFTKGVTAGDYDNDGDLDLFVSNFGPNQLYRNRGDGTFEEVAAAAGVTGPERSFATWFFDYDNDGRLDIFVANYEAPIAAVAADYLGLPYRAGPPALYRNQGDGTFRDVTVEVGLRHAYLPMGANFGDFDNDGWLDIYLATGDPNYESLMPNVALRNAGGRRFQNVTTTLGLGHLQKGHGVTFADIDNDGDSDLYHQLGGFYPGDGFRNALFVNPGQTVGGERPRSLTITLQGKTSNRDGFGVRIDVRVDTADGPRTIHRAPGSVSSFGGSPRRQEIGLGNAARILRLRIRWPASKSEQVFENVPLDRFIHVVEGAKSYEVQEPARIQF